MKLVKLAALLVSALTAITALPAAADNLADVEVEAMRRRIDLIILRYEIVTLAKSVGFVEATRYMSFLELGLGYRNELEVNDEGRQSSKNRYGLDLGIVIPVFDTGEARVTTARWSMPSKPFV